MNPEKVEREKYKDEKSRASSSNVITESGDGGSN